MPASQCLELARQYAKDVRVAVLADGVFYRNLPKEEVAKRYGNASAEFGYRIKCGKWTNSTDGLSVNAAECCSPQCSVAIGGRQAPHVAEIRLKHLGEITQLELYARYDPVEGPRENPCHYLVLPRSAPPEDLIAALARLEDEIPKTQPKSPTEHESFRQAAAAFDSALRLLRDVVAEPT